MLQSFVEILLTVLKISITYTANNKTSIWGYGVVISNL